MTQEGRHCAFASGRHVVINVRILLMLRPRQLFARSQFAIPNTSPFEPGASSRESRSLESVPRLTDGFRQKMSRSNDPGDRAPDIAALFFHLWCAEHRGTKGVVCSQNRTPEKYLSKSSKKA